MTHVHVLQEKNLKIVTANKYMENCVFCKIIKGELEVKKVYEDEFVLAFVPRDQVNKGHVLVIPKEHAAGIADISKSALEKVMAVVQELSQKYLKESGATGINLLQANGKDAQQSVFHFHMHIVPRYPDDGLDLWMKAGIEK